MQGRNDNLAIAACATALGSLVPVALFQSGLIRSLPDPPGALFESERITSSKTAHPFGIPDSYLGLVSYGVTLGLLIAAKRSPAVRPVLGAKLTVDAASAGFNAIRQVVTFGKLCSWCTGTAVATAVMVYGGRAAIAEAGRTSRHAL